jgi:hypothetical protein
MNELHFLYAWNKFSIDTAGRLLPVNYISEDSIGYAVDDTDAPIQTTEGPVRRIVLTHPKDMPLDS